MDHPENPPSIRKLPVLPNSGKVDQLRDEAQSSPPTKKLADRTPIDDALDPSLSLEQRLLRAKVIAALKTVYDPEIPVNIFDLGLVYEIRIDADNAVHLQMTLTAPGCPVAGTLPGEIQRKIESVEGVTAATVELVWDPPWDKSRMSEEALLELGLL